MSVEPVSGTDGTPVPDAIVGAGVLDHPVHLARCAECRFETKFRPSASGAAFTLVDSDATLGIGEHGRPRCPNGHGELGIADEQLVPAREAIAQTAEKVAKQQRLPIPVPPFNYAGALHEIFEQRAEVRSLAARAKALHEKYADAKSEADEAGKLLATMLDTFEQRERDRSEELERQAVRAEAGLPAEDEAHTPSSNGDAPAATGDTPDTPQAPLTAAPETDATERPRCAFERAEPNETCAICGDIHRASTKGFSSDRDAPEHLEQARAYGRYLDAEQLLEDLRVDVSLYLTLEVVLQWTDEERDQVIAWVEGQLGVTDERPERPTILGTPHVAPAGYTSETLDGGKTSEEYQSCTQCDERILTLADDVEPYPTGAFVGTDCKGKPKKKSTRGPISTTALDRSAAADVETGKSARRATDGHASARHTPTPKKSKGKARRL